MFRQFSCESQWGRPLQWIQTRQARTGHRFPGVSLTRPQHYVVISTLKPGLRTFSLNTLVKKRHPSLFPLTSPDTARCSVPSPPCTPGSAPLNHDAGRENGLLWSEETRGSRRTQRGPLARLASWSACSTLTALPLVTSPFATSSIFQSLCGGSRHLNSLNTQLLLNIPDFLSNAYKL